MKRCFPLVVALIAGAAPCAAQSFYLAPDVPTDLAGATRQPWQIVRHDGDTYATALSLPAFTPLGALYRRCSGAWLFTVETPTELPSGSGVVFDPRDVVQFDGTSYSRFFNGAAAGLAPGVRVDAVALDHGDPGQLLLSFDVPTTLGGVTYDPADVVLRTVAGFSLLFDASAAIPPLPASTNVVAVSRRSAQWVLSIDIPTTLGSATYLPGDLVAWNGSAWSLYHRDGAWSPASIFSGAALLAEPGRVAETLRVERATTPGNLVLRWAAAASADAEEYGIYEGALGAWYSHASVRCADAGHDLTEEITPASGSRYFLVVSLNPNEEGSYGLTSAGAERPRGSSSCRATQALGCL